MVLVELINILKSDTTLATLLGASVSNSKIMPMPLITQGIGYNFIPLTNNNEVQQSQFELTIINTELIRCCEIKEQLDKLLVTTGDDSLTDSITGCSQNGGGCWYDDVLKMYKLQANYTIIEREC